jgi:hypothetical protein
MKKIKIKTNIFGMVLSLAAMLLVARTTPLQAQTEYHPITDGCVWSVSNEKYMAVGDTVLNGKTYMKIYRQVAAQSFEFSLENAEYFAAIRDDSVEQRVYAFIPSGTWIHDLSDYSEARTDTALEVLLYDFSVAVGDTLTYYMLGDSYIVKGIAVRAESANISVGWSEHALVTHQFSAVDTVVYLSDNTPRRQIFLHELSYFYNRYHVWVEGIGSVNGFDESLQATMDDYGEKILLCFTDSSGAEHLTGYDFDDEPNDCFSKGFGGDVPVMEKLSVRVYPNPTDDLLHIELSGAEIANIALYDLQGRVVTGEDAHAGAPQRGGNVTINMRSVPAGVYLLRVTAADGKEYHRKIVKR